MAAMQGHSPTPPHLLNTNTAVSSHSPSPRHSPSPQNAQQAQFGRPRNTSESLDPLSAAFPQGYMGGDWGSGAAFRNHRRKPSDALSEYSSHSNQASPYMNTLDSFDQSSTHVSPMLGAQNDTPLFNELGMMNQFSLNEPGLNPNDHISPVHSLHNSPRIPAQQQQPLPQFTSNDNFGLNTDMNMQYQQHDNNFNNFPNLGTFDPNAFPTFHTDVVSPEGQADAMSPPEINIDFAPPSRQPSFGPRARAGSSNELAPPDAMRRKRAKSDPYSGSRSSSPGAPPSRGRSPSLQPSLNGQSQLSPAAIQLPASRSPSPAGRNRSNSAASDSRQYLIDLADPDRATAGPGGDQKRQKHPATFQCHLCPKRFTRAYNLRSHLRTHTDERPFVCTVCGKAFARQHDRKRHEGLHSGEKKFVCKGQLKTGSTWGCGRRFARADALGRHFRSEAGRECIKPLLDEEAEERRKTWMEEQRQRQLQSQQGFIAPNPLTEMPVAPQLPAVLLQMYPDLAGFDFGAPLTGNMGVVDEGDYGGRSSFDASGGSEFEMSDNDMGFDTGMSMGGQNYQQQGNWA
ncbi:hypothetical protein BDZ85DRAFT_198062 [Elsinoe ampelina]|uniref:C2H2-type domain-containing protein n=1 Tax=Elsinoe ampelina TaxID=302913 RepID=A0A6A6GD08_9PEZI|nr:hypothetical protein BDZ85DRAFT_198062 [Elsinoe ampelina]